MDIYELIKLRKSVRSYLPKAIEDDKLNRILDAGRLAPSASNSQEWRFIIVKNEESRRLLAASTNKHDFIAEAPAIIVCCAETDQRIMRCGISAFTVDVSIVIDHITLAATEEGLGTCWIGGFDAEQVKQVLGIPEGIVVVELLPIGYPRDPSLKPKNRLPLESLVHHETW
jgi:nitroreductase